MKFHFCCALLNEDGTIARGTSAKLGMIGGTVEERDWGRGVGGTWTSMEAGSHTAMSKI